MNPNYENQQYQQNDANYGYEGQETYQENGNHQYDGQEQYEYDDQAEYANPFENNEDLNGVRFSWNEWPVTKVEAERAVVPVGCLYTPMKEIQGLPVVQYAPIRCHNSNCGAVLNPWCSTDLRSKLWSCPFCLTRNQFPAHYAEHISETNLPAELMADYTSIEYELQHKTAGPPAFVFVVDTSLSVEELNELKDSLEQCFAILPSDALVGLVTFGTLVQVHELGHTAMPKSYVFRGTKDITAAKLATNLGIKFVQGSQQPINNFVLPVSECGMILDTILKDLKPDPWPVRQGERKSRATGVALSIAVSLCEKLFNRRGARIMLFVGGPPTSGPGSICSKSLKEALRSHTDIQKGRTPHMKEAKKFYTSLSERCVTNCHCVDMFASSLDQVGLLEMRGLMDDTGGVIVLADSFSQSVFKESFRRVFVRSEDQENLKMGLAGTVEIITGKEFKVRGAIGACKSLKKKSGSVSDNPVGESGTYAWRVCAMGSESTLAFYFDVSDYYGI